MVVFDEAVEGEVPRVLAVDLPEEERADGVVAHEAVEQSRDLVGVPNEFALDRRQHEVLSLDPIQHFGDGDRHLERHALLLRVAFVRDRISLPTRPYYARADAPRSAPATQGAAAG